MLFFADAQKHHRFVYIDLKSRKLAYFLFNCNNLSEFSMPIINIIFKTCFFSFL